MPSGTAVKPGDVVRQSVGQVHRDHQHRRRGAAGARRRAVVREALQAGGRHRRRDADRRVRHRARPHGDRRRWATTTALVREVLAAGKRAGEPGWQLPLWDDYKELIKSDVADIKNTGGRPAGTITAALFLKEFAESIRGCTSTSPARRTRRADLVTIPRGPTGVPIGTFVEFVRGTRRADARSRRRTRRSSLGLGAPGRGRFAGVESRAGAARRDTVAGRRDTMPPRVDSTRVPRRRRRPRHDPRAAAARADSVRAATRHAPRSSKPPPTRSRRRSRAPSAGRSSTIGAALSTGSRDALFATGALTLARSARARAGRHRVHAPAGSARRSRSRTLGDFAPRAHVPRRRRAGPARSTQRRRAGVELTFQLWHARGAARSSAARTRCACYLRTWRVDRTTPYTRVDVATGDLDTNIYRGFFGRRFAHGEALQLGGAAIQHAADRALPAADGDSTLLLGAARRRAAMERGCCSTHGPAQSRAVRRRYRNVARRRSIRFPTLETHATDAYARVGYGDPRARSWVQLMAATHRLRVIEPRSRSTITATGRRDRLDVGAGHHGDVARSTCVAGAVSARIGGERDRRGSARPAVRRRRSRPRRRWRRVCSLALERSPSSQSATRRVDATARLDSDCRASTCSCAHRAALRDARRPISAPIVSGCTARRHVATVGGARYAPSRSRASRRGRRRLGGLWVSGGVLRRATRPRSRAGASSTPRRAARAIECEATARRSRVRGRL